MTHPNHYYKRKTLPAAPRIEESSESAEGIVQALKMPDQADGWPGVIIPAVVIGIVVAYAQRKVN